MRHRDTYFIPTQRPASFASETDLAKPVVEYLQIDEWDVYQEVKNYNRAADIVAIRGVVTQIVEVKLRLGSDVLDQARRWHGYANYLWCAVPAGRYSKWIYDLACERYGIGLLRVAADGHVMIERQAALNRRTHFDFRKSVYEKQKTHCLAGSFNGQRWTPFQETCANLLKVVENQPGVTLRDAIKQLRTHYSNETSAVGSIKKMLDRRVITDIAVRYDGRKVTLWPQDAAF